jgi:hypothetical protein
MVGTGEIKYPGWTKTSTAVRQLDIELSRARGEDARGETTKINYGVDTRERRKRGRPRKNVDGRCTSSHENKTFRNRSAVKQKGIVFGFRKTATAVTRPER